LGEIWQGTSDFNYEKSQVDAYLSAVFGSSADRSFDFVAVFSAVLGWLRKSW
jgi:hypothetical protein